MDSKRENVLITGGRGFIGRAVSRRLQRSGDAFLSLDSEPVPDTESDSQILCDISDRDALERVFRSHSIDTVIHLAAILPTAAQRNPIRATQVNVIGSLNLLELARQHGVRRFVFGSSLSVYGSCPADQIVSESHRAAPEDLYGVAKTYVEQFGEIVAQSGGPEFVSLRIGRVVGPGAHSTTSAWRSQIFECLGATVQVEISLPYMGTERILLVHVDDVGQMIVTLLRAKTLRHSIYNAVCESVVVAELKRELEQLNPNIRVRFGQHEAVGNPRQVDCSRYQEEFGFRLRPIFEQLRSVAQE